jgi:hypothetical protein
MTGHSMKAIIVNSKKTLEALITAVTAAWEKDKYLRVSWKIGKDRSTDQQALSEVWYRQVSQQLAEDTPEGVKLECKLRFGVPILRAGDPDFCAMWDDRIKGILSYEQKLALMRYLPVTSLMTTEQMSNYMDTVQKEYARRGIVLESASE